MRLSFKAKQWIKRFIFFGGFFAIYQLMGVFGILQIVLMIGLMVGQFAMIFWFMARYGAPEISLPGEVPTRWTDVYGQDKVVKRMKQMQVYLEDPERIESRGGYVPKGVVLWGPPGVGKTLMAKAFAGETKFPFILVQPGAFAAMFIGVNFLKVARLFRSARKLADQYGGCVVFLDEIDSLGSRGGNVNDGPQNALRATERPLESKFQAVVGGFSGGNMGTLEAVLSKLDGLERNTTLYSRFRKFLGFKPLPPVKRRILFFGATNMLQRLDPALLRDGRFDRKLYVGYPNLEGRIATFKGYLDRIANNISDEQIRVLAQNNPKSSGAFIRGVINEGLINAIEDGRDMLTWADMREAIIFKEMGESRGRQPNEKDQWATALHEAGHAVAAHHFMLDHKIQFASVEIRGHTLGVVSPIQEEERYSETKSEIEANIKVFLAGYWAEKEWFGDVSTGPSSDLLQANRLADLMISRWALDDDNMAIVLTNEEEALAEWLFDRRTEVLKNLYEEMAAFLGERKDQVEAVAHLLDRLNTVDGVEIHKILATMESERR